MLTVICHAVYKPVTVITTMLSKRMLNVSFCFQYWDVVHFCSCPIHSPFIEKKYPGHRALTAFKQLLLNVIVNRRNKTVVCKCIIPLFDNIQLPQDLISSPHCFTVALYFWFSIQITHFHTTVSIIYHGCICLSSHIWHFDLICYLHGMA